jgi:hypothetical protein
MTYEHLGLQHINGPHTPRPTTQLWPIELGLSAQTSCRALHDGLRRAPGYGGQNDDASDHRRSHVIRHGKYETARQPWAPRVCVATPGVKPLRGKTVVLPLPYGSFLGKPPLADPSSSL